MGIKKPVFIIGAGRSGSTIFHKIFSEHPNLAWLSTWCRKYPDTPSINKTLMQAIDYPIVGDYLRGRFLPGEFYEFWEYYCKGFRRPCRDLLSVDVTNKAKEDIKDALSKTRNVILGYVCAFTCDRHSRIYFSPSFTIR